MKIITILLLSSYFISSAQGGYRSTWVNNSDAKVRIKVESKGLCTNFGAVGSNMMIKNNSSEPIEFDLEVSNDKNINRTIKTGKLNGNESFELGCNVWPNSESKQTFKWTIIKARFAE